MTYAAPATTYAAPAAQYSYPAQHYNPSTGSVVMQQANPTTGSVVMNAPTYQAHALPAQGTISSGAYHGYQYAAQPPVTYPATTLPTATSMVAYPQYTFQTGSYVAPQQVVGMTQQQV